MTYIKLSYVDREGGHIGIENRYIEHGEKGDITEIVCALDKIREDLLALQERMH